MNEIPDRIKRVVKRHAYKAYICHYMFIAPWINAQDLEQVIYAALHKRKLWDCPDLAIVARTAKSACIDYVRVKVRGYRQRERLPDRPFKEESWTDGILQWEGRTNNCITLKTLLPYLTRKQRYVVSLVIEGWSQERIGRTMGLTGGRVSQIYMGAVARLRKIYKRSIRRC